jgi:ribosomal protein S27E
MKKRLYPIHQYWYNDRFIKCPKCKNEIYYLVGTHKYIKCDSCGYKIRDKVYKESCSAYKGLKRKEIL